MLTNAAAIRLLITFIDLTELQAHFDRNGKINLMRATTAENFWIVEIHQHDALKG